VYLNCYKRILAIWLISTHEDFGDDGLGMTPGRMLWWYRRELMLKVVAVRSVANVVGWIRGRRGAASTSGWK
jgi:hypothetical protein